MFADSIYNRLAALLACFLAGLVLIIARRAAGTTGFVVQPRRWVVEDCSAGLGGGGACRRRTRRYHGNPMAAHLPLGLDPAHFARWLALFEATARAECTAEGAEHLLERARRIARGLEMGVAVQRGELPPARRRRH